MIPSIFLILAVVIYRIAFAFWGDPATGASSWMVNFSPMAALFFFSALYWPRHLAISIPFLGLLISDVLLNAHFGVAPLSWAMLARYACFAGILWMGFSIKKIGNGWLQILGGTLVGSVLFYLVSNTTAWFASPVYAQNFGGWLQSLTVGLPGFPPTYLFFRNSLVSDLLFTAVFILCWKASGKEAGARLKDSTASPVAGATTI